VLKKGKKKSCVSSLGKEEGKKMSTPNLEKRRGRRARGLQDVADNRKREAFEARRSAGVEQSWEGGGGVLLPRKGGEGARKCALRREWRITISREKNQRVQLIHQGKIGDAAERGRGETEEGRESSRGGESSKLTLLKKGEVRITCLTREKGRIRGATSWRGERLKKKKGRSRIVFRDKRSRLSRERNPADLGVQEKGKRLESTGKSPFQTYEERSPAFPKKGREGGGEEAVDFL